MTLWTLSSDIHTGIAAKRHDGSKETLAGVVDFYDKRFKIGFTSKERQDLVNFLKTL
jgi:hypothetical protein